MRSPTDTSSPLSTTFAIFALLASHVRGNTLQPVSVDFGQDFLGYDGAWSAAQIRVGSPEQYLSVFPSTISSETWVAGPTLCDGTSTCSSLRGGLFYSENSTTWRSLGQYELGYSSLSQTTNNAEYGFDNISISDTISTSNQVIAIVDDLSHWIGEVGLNVQETRFSNNTNNLALISTLVQNNSIIPSHSYGYTAGAAYQGRGIQGSLTFGGVDSSRYTSNDLWFDLGPGYVPSAFLRSMEVSATVKPGHWVGNPLPLLSQTDAAAFTIDSSTPYLWLPEQACDSIAQALNLTWDPTIELYTFSNGSSPEDLENLNIQFTFRLANSLTSSDLIALQLSYGAFNLQLSYPFPGLFQNYSDDKISYFPLRRANSTQQYTIGRAFLQETYLIVDYERNQFSLSQALFPDTSTQPELTIISRPDDSGWPGPNGESPSSGGLSTGAKVGIIVGIIVVVGLVTGLVWFCYLRRRRQNKSEDDEKSQRTGLLSVFSKRSLLKSSGSDSAAELHADKHHPTEMTSDSSNSRFELSAVAPTEMAGAEVSPSFFQERSNARIPQINDPRAPIELVQPAARNSVSKENFASHQHNVDRAESPAPAYSPTDSNQNNSHSISPFSPRHGRNPFTNSGSDNGVSPVTGSNSHSDRDRLSVGHTRDGSGSSRFLSPVSPVQARSEPQNSSYSSTQGSSTNPVSNPSRSLSPPIASQVPRRSPSRDSRFREDLAEDEPRQNPIGKAQSRGSKASRFSWED